MKQWRRKATTTGNWGELPRPKELDQMGELLGTNGVSCTTAGLRLDRTSHHSRAAVTTSIATTAMKNSATIAFNRSLKISRAPFGATDAARVAACAKKPRVGSAEYAFCYPDVIVAMVRH